jgi:hypothetical protein
VDNIPLVALGGMGVGVLSVAGWSLEGMGRVWSDLGWVRAGCRMALGAQVGRQAYLHSLSVQLRWEFSSMDSGTSCSPHYLGSLLAHFWANFNFDC